MYTSASYAETSTTSASLSRKQHLPPLKREPIFGSLSPHLGTVLGDRYRLIQEVGRGSFGRVFQAVDMHKNNRIVAVKQLCLSLVSPNLRSVARQMFRCEITALAHLAHPHIPRLHISYTDRDPWSFVFDFIDGEVLDNYLERRGGLLPLAEVLDIGIQLCSVLNYLHTRQIPILFRDLKPNNVMRLPNRQIMLIDFGLACPFTPDQIDTVALGTRGFAAPEQYSGEYGQAYTTPRSDIYSLGVLLFYLLFGQLPSVQRTPVSPSSIQGQNSPAVSTTTMTVLSAMLEADPMCRPTGIGEVARELHRLKSVVCRITLDLAQIW